MSANSTVQSNALSPPPNIKTRLLKYFDLSLTAYSNPLPSKSSNPSISGFLGLNVPAPPAIITLDVINVLLPFVFRVNLLSRIQPSDLSCHNVKTVSFKWNVGLKGLICFNNELTCSLAV